MKLSRKTSVIIPNGELGESIANEEKYTQAQILDGFAKRTLAYQGLDRLSLKELTRIMSAETLLVVRWVCEIATEEGLIDQIPAETSLNWIERTIDTECPIYLTLKVGGDLCISCEHFRDHQNSTTILCKGE